MYECVVSFLTCGIILKQFQGASCPNRRFKNFDSSVKD